MKIFRVVTTILTFITSILFATTINVPADSSTIQSGIDGCSNGDTVLVQPGTYVENINFNGKNIVVGSLFLITQDTSYISQTVIDGNQTGSVVRFENAEERSACIIGVTIINGMTAEPLYGFNGGGIYCYQSSPTISNVKVKNNYAEKGGGIYIYLGAPLITNSTIHNNTARNGIGIYSFGSNAVLNKILIDSNHPIGGNGFGGGIYILAGQLSVFNCTIVNNTAREDGGGVFTTGSNSLIINTIIADNSGDYGIYCYSGSPLISYSNLWNNELGNFYNVGQQYGINNLLNFNGDSCDVYFNIQQNSQFINTANYNLQNGSPCIDAGDPSSINDPDGSISDIGAFPSPYGTPVPIVLNVPSYYSTIQAALNAAEFNDTVLVQPGTYYENIIWPETNGIKLISAGDSSNTIIDGGGVSSVIYMNPQTTTIDTTTQIQGFTITNGGNVSYGGGLFLKGSPKLLTLNVKSNSANEDGGGFYLNGSFAIIINSSISKNNALYRGGGVFNGDKSASQFISVNINKNYGGTGGGVFITDSKISLDSCTINNNSAEDNGGGIMVIGNGILHFNNGFITNNNTNGGGGGILSASNSELNLNETEISYNLSASGGGIHLQNSDNKLNIINKCIIKENQAISSGGGLYIYGTPDIRIKKTFILGNHSIKGGGLYIAFSNTRVDSSLLINNSAELGGSIYFYRSVSDSINNTLIYNNEESLHGNGIYIYDSKPIASNTTLLNSNIYIDKGEIKINHSNLVNSRYGLFNSDNSTIIAAENNWWGHVSGPYHPSQNPTGQGDSVNAFVNITPWLTEPNTFAPPIPAQNLTVSSTGNDFISLNWDSSPIGDFAGFKLYYDSDSTGYPYNNSVDVSADTSYTLSGLNLGTEYFLAVTVYDTDGNESWYSNGVSGFTRVMQVQNLDIGINEDLQHLVTHTPTITFGYYDSMGESQTHYQIQISTLSDFSSVDMWDSGEVASSDTAVTYAGTALEDGVDYYLRVKVAVSSFWSDWASLSFRMNSIPSVPSLTSPIDNQVVVEPILLTINSSSDSEDDLIQYVFYVFDDNSREIFVDSSGLINDTTWIVQETLADNNQYWWYAKTYDGYEYSDLAIAESFLVNTENNVPAEFSLLSPGINEEVTTLLPAFIWNSSFDPDPLDTVRYTLYLDTPDPGVLAYEAGLDTTWQVTEPLLDNQEYFWRVVSGDILGFEMENIDGYQRFTTNSVNEPPSVVNLLSPDSVIVLTLFPEFHWTEAIDPDPDDSVHYELHWVKYGDDFVDSVLTDTNYAIPYAPLDDNSKFYWWVISMDRQYDLSHSEEAVFWTDLYPEAPLAFQTVYPLDETLISDTSVTLIWNSTTDPDPLDRVKYSIVFGGDYTEPTEFDTFYVQQDTSFTTPISLAHFYNWKVIAHDGDGFYVFSNNGEWRHFFTPDLATQNELLLPDVYAMHQNYPNPFNPITTLRYDLPENSFVNVIIYDMLGRQVRTLINQTQDAGYKSVIWNATNDNGKPVSAGVYLYQIRAHQKESGQADEYVQTKKMVLLK